MSGAIPVLPQMCLNVMDRENFTFTFTFIVLACLCLMRDTERQKLKQKLIQNNTPQFIVMANAFNLALLWTFKAKNNKPIAILYIKHSSMCILSASH